MTEDQHRELIARTAERYPTIVREINHCVAELREEIQSQHPFLLLAIAHYNFLRHHVKIRAEVEIGREEGLAVRALEYIHSVIASTEPSDEVLVPTDFDWVRISSKIQTLYDSIDFGYFPAWLSLSENKLFRESEQSAMYGRQFDKWLHVRGEIYPVHQHESLTHLLLTHDETLKIHFNVDANAIVNGSVKITKTLSGAFVDQDGNIAQIRINPEVNSADSPKGAKTRTVKLLDSFDKLPFGSADCKLLTGAFANSIGFSRYFVDDTYGWTPALRGALSFTFGENDTFFDGQEQSGWPTRLMPVFQRPLLQYQGMWFAFSPMIMTDRFYRMVEDAVMRVNPSARQQWNSQQNEASEALVAELIVACLPSSNLIQNPRYKDPGFVEIDAVVSYKDILFVIETKAGRLLSSSKVSDFSVH